MKMKTLFKINGMQQKQFHEGISQADLNKQEKSQINNLILYLKELKKEE